MRNKSFSIKLLSLVVMLLSVEGVVAEEVEWYDGESPVTYFIQGKTDPVVVMALDMFAGDMDAVTGKRAIKTGEKLATIRVVQLDRATDGVKKSLAESGVPVEDLKKRIDGFHIAVIDGKIIIVGTNGRGTAYGVLELSRMAGVSPWIWWGDLVPEKREQLVIDCDFETTQGASVEYRGIFLNDEDWSTRPWSYGNFEPGKFGYIGSETYKKIFQLLMRLRANAIWPGMHEGTTAFFKVEGAKAVADSCGIVIGTSHCEPLLRNNVDEWNVRERGRFNYITNKEEVHNYWIERLQEVSKSQNNMFTIGMRGIHDGSMEGVKTMQEKFDALQQVVDDQQELIAKYVGNPSQQVQVFVPYKEVLEIYERGLKVPEYVTLMWCDDNYGYMTRLSNSDEQQRIGGGGVYYHLSYWGRPHDYLWLTTTQPGLIYNEMRAAYDHNVRKIWICNVHDPKVAGYDLELFLDMAWNIDCVSAQSLDNHYKAWLCRQFGSEIGERLFPAMHEFFRLCGQRRPEFMGWTQVELSKTVYDRGLSHLRNTEFNSQVFGNELDRYLERYNTICQMVEELEVDIRPELKDAYFAAIKYPVLAASAHATKVLEAQRARQYAVGNPRNGMTDNPEPVYIAAAKSQKAYQEIRSLTEHYNLTMAGGKWNRLMNMAPRDLPVFGAPVLPVLLTDKEVEEYLEKSPARKEYPIKLDGAIACNACDYDYASEGTEVVQMLGHSMNAVALQKDGELAYNFVFDGEGEAVLRVALIPTQPNDDGDLRFSVSVDGATPVVYTLKEKFRSEGWKQNVLRGQSVRELKLNLYKGHHTLKIKALDPHIIVDQWMIDTDMNRKFYLFPIEYQKVMKK
ncbi:MAG: glycosyl hydrolase 115 family protein [Bacteroidaceae bacterium]|nr:glycosyl hydrolase 115 family protein [Bacteroidaceae bacterium]